MSAEEARDIDRLRMFERYIHTNETSDEGGWFAFLQPDGEFSEEQFESRVNGCATEEDALRGLIAAKIAEVDRLKRALRRIDVCYRESSGLPLHEQAYGMRSEAKMALNPADEPAGKADLRDMFARVGKSYTLVRISSGETVEDAA